MFPKALNLMLPIAMGALLAAVPAVPAFAQSAVAPEFTKRTADLVAFINGDLAADKLFAADTLSKLPLDQIKATNADMHSKMGKAVGVSAVQALGPREATFSLDFEKGKLGVKMRLEDQEPYGVNGIGIAPPGQ